MFLICVTFTNIQVQLLSKLFRVTFLKFNFIKILNETRNERILGGWIIQKINLCNSRTCVVKRFSDSTVKEPFGKLTLLGQLI